MGELLCVTLVGVLAASRSVHFVFYGCEYHQEILALNAMSSISSPLRPS
eukprot:COSAG01_NODE_24_length_37608_cov_19.303154_4_plen_49_part_00